MYTAYVDTCFLSFLIKELIDTCKKRDFSSPTFARGILETVNASAFDNGSFQRDLSENVPIMISNWFLPHFSRFPTRFNANHNKFLRIFSWLWKQKQYCPKNCYFHSINYEKIGEKPDWNHHQDIRWKVFLKMSLSTTR